MWLTVAGMSLERKIELKLCWTENDPLRMRTDLGLCLPLPRACLTLRPTSHLVSKDLWDHQALSSHELDEENQRR